MITFQNAHSSADLANLEFQEVEASSLFFVDDASYEFVGGGMAANGL